MCRISGSRRKGMEKRHPCGKNRLEKTPEQRAGQLVDSLLSSGDDSLFIGYRMNYSIIGCLFSRLVKQFWIVEMYTLARCVILGQNSVSSQPSAMLGCPSSKRIK